CGTSPLNIYAPPGSSPWPHRGPVDVLTSTTPVRDVENRNSTVAHLVPPAISLTWKSAPWERVSVSVRDGERDCECACVRDGVNFTAPPYGKVLLLGAIAAASAFVVTILIVLLCVGCQRKGKSNNVPAEGTKHRIMDMSRLRQSKLRSISKSDTKLHQMNKPNCNGKSE
ncbi:hypothetical protein Z043_124129, partial [Scleropages formosus]